MVDRSDVRDAAQRGKRGLEDTAEAVRERRGTMRWVAIGVGAFVVVGIVAGLLLGW